MRHHNVLVTLALFAFAIGGCDGPQQPLKTNQATGDESSRSAEDAPPAEASRPISVDPGYGEKLETADLAETAPVRLTAIRDAILVGRAIKCWPPTRVTLPRLDLTDSAAKIETLLDAAIGKRRPDISCDRAPPANLPIDPKPIGDNMYADPLAQFVGRLPIFGLLSRAYEQGEIPFDHPPPTMRRRWRSAVRIRPPRDSVMAEALRTVIASAAFRQAVHGLSVTLTNEQPNALIVDAKTMLSCKSGPGDDCPPPGIRRGPGWIDGARWPRDDLARRLTGGRRSWFDDGSDFSAMVPIWPIDKETGFTVGSDTAIEAAVCAVPNRVMDPVWRKEAPNAAISLPSYRQQYAILCLLRILGVGGVAKEMTSYPKFDERNLDLLPVRGPRNDPIVVFGRAPLEALDVIYR